MFYFTRSPSLCLQSQFPQNILLIFLSILFFSELKPEYSRVEETSKINAPELLQAVQAFKPNVFNSFNQKYGKYADEIFTALPFYRFGWPGHQ